MRTIPVQTTEIVVRNAQMTEQQLAYALIHIANGLLGVVDDGDQDHARDLHTEDTVFIGSRDWPAPMQSAKAAALVDAANILLYGHKLYSSESRKEFYPVDISDEY